MPVFETLAGYLLFRLGHIPAPGENVTFEDRRFTVTQMDRNRIAKVRIEKVLAPDARRPPRVRIETPTAIRRQSAGQLTGRDPPGIPRQGACFSTLTAIILVLSASVPVLSIRPIVLPTVVNDPLGTYDYFRGLARTGDIGSDSRATLPLKNG